MLAVAMTDLHADYDEGYFDKDEQGWCARRVVVTTAGDRVTIHRSGDDNGMRPYESSEVGTLGESFPDLGLIKIEGERGTIAYFDTRTGRIRHPGEQTAQWFKAPPGYREPGCLAVGLALISPVAEALGLDPGPPPTDLEMPPMVASPTAEGAVESLRQIPGANGCTWDLMLRDFPPDHELGQQFQTYVHGNGGYVMLFAAETVRAGFIFSGPLEHYARAIALRDRLLAAWGVP